MLSNRDANLVKGPYEHTSTLLAGTQPAGTGAVADFFLVLANVALAISQFAEPVLFGRVVDALSNYPSDGVSLWPHLLPLLSIWAGFGLFTIICGTLVALYADRLAHRRRHAVLAIYFEHILQLPLVFHGTHHSGRLSKVMLQGTDALWTLWHGFLREHFTALMGLIVLLPFSVVLNWRLGLILVALSLTFLMATAFVLRKAGTLQSQVVRHYSDLAERASDAVGNVALVQSFTLVEAEVSGLRAVIDNLLAAQIPVLSWWAVVAILTRAATTISILSILCVGAWMKTQGLASVGEIVTFMSFATLLITRLQGAINFLNRVFLEEPNLHEFFAVLDANTVPRDNANSIYPRRVRGDVEFKNVSFSYDGKLSALTDVSFTARAGETIALVGPTGAGKTTALAILYRAFDPQAGVVKVDDIDIREFNVLALRRNIGAVFQEPLLFNRSILENLRMGKPDATEAEIISAVTRAHALDFIRRSHSDFQTIVGERGRLLSMGERQRLSIARALLKNPPILILDEATSSLDAETEINVLMALDEVMKNRTTFVIAHRLSTVRNATQILFFDSGRIVERGTYEELINAGGRFASLAEAYYRRQPRFKNSFSNEPD